MNRELLEMAAKAAGVVGNYVQITAEWGEIHVESGWTHHAFNPLQSDADALRLAVEMRADISIGLSVKVVLFSPLLKDEDSICGRWVVQGRNDAAAVRECIVRAAANIGEQMP